MLMVNQLTGFGAGGQITGPISFVGGSSRVGAGSLSLTALTGGIGSAPIEGDLVIVAIGDVAGNKAFVDYDIAISSPSGYTEVADIFYDIGGTSGYHTNLGVFYKLQGASPDTSITIANYDTTRAIAYVLRGVNQTTPLDATSTTATGTGSTLDPPSITTVTANSWVIAILSATYTNTAIVAPTGYSNLVNAGTSAAFPAMAIASKLVASAGAENPGAFTGFTQNSSDSWCAATMAIRTA